jgi:hypothetical protein
VTKVRTERKAGKAVAHKLARNRLNEPRWDGLRSASNVWVSSGGAIPKAHVQGIDCTVYTGALDLAQSYVPKVELANQQPVVLPC